MTYEELKKILNHNPEVFKILSRLEDHERSIGDTITDLSGELVERFEITAKD